MNTGKKLLIRFGSWMIGMMLITTSVMAQDVTMTLPDTLLQAGDQEWLSVEISEMTEEDDVISGEFTLEYDRSLITIAEIETDQTLLETTGNVMYNPTTGKVAFASDEQIVGEGVLFYLGVEMNTDAEPGNSTALTLSDEMLNNGTPSLGVVGGELKVPQINIDPTSFTIVEGDSMQFNVSGDIFPPVEWSITNEEIATIDQDGWLYTEESGFLRVLVEDAIGNADSTDLFRVEPVVFKDLTISTPDTDAQQTLSFQFPVNISDLTGLDIISIQGELLYDTNDLEFLDIDLENTMLEGTNLEINTMDEGIIQFAAASNESFDGSGTLFYLEFNVDPDAAGSHTPQLQDVLLNEDIEPDYNLGEISFESAPDIFLSEESLELVTGESAVITVEEGGQEPYSWESENPAVATVDAENGTVEAISRGTTKVKAYDQNGFPSETALVTVLDAEVSLPDTSIGNVGEFAVEIHVTDISNLGIYSYEVGIELDTTVVKFTKTDTDGSLSEDMSLAANVNDEGILRVAAAGAGELEGEGILISLGFEASIEAEVGDVTDLVFESFSFNDPALPGPTARVSDGSVEIISMDFLSAPDLQSPQDATEDISLNPELNWTVVDDAASYRLQIAEDEQFSQMRIDTSEISGTSLIAEDLDESTTYFWRVRAVDEEVQSEWSITWSFTTETLSPGIVELDQPDDGASDLPLDVNLSWFEAELAEEYRLQLSLDEEFENLVTDSTGVTGTSITVENLEEMTTYWWRVQSMRSGTTSDWSSVRSFTTEQVTGVGEHTELPRQLSLKQNYPNPFNPTTNIRFGLPENSEVRAAVYDMLGRRVTLLIDETRQAGWHEITFDASDLSSGIYYFRLIANGKERIRSMTLIK